MCPAVVVVESELRRRLDTYCSSTPEAVSTVNSAPDDGHGICTKHVERPTGNNKVLYKVSYRWNFLNLMRIYLLIYSRLHPILFNYPT
jgi:hypothetical protein